MRSSITHPLEIAQLRVQEGYGLIGLTLCPGKQQAHGMTGAWARDLELDLAVIERWNTSAVVTLTEADELAALKVPQLGAAISARHMAWYHLPIQDCSVPDAAFEAAWVTTGEELRVRLRSGANVLLHCKGGLGRAGLVAARLMIELGHEPGAAVAAVRKARPGAIETEAQLAHALAQRAVPEPLPDTTLGAIRDRAVAALLGLAAGDALGTTLEFSPRDSRPRLTDMIGGGPFRLEAGTWTDDTAMALALAESLIEHNGLDETDLMQRFTRWYEEGEYSPTGTCFDIGLTVREALARFKREGNPLAGSSDPLSAGNGSLMRLAPVAIRYWNDRPALRDAAARQSRTTHGAAEAVDACVAYGELVADAIAGQPRSAVLGSACSPDNGYAGTIAAVMAGSWKEQRRQTIRASGYVAHSLEAALWSTARSATWEEAVLTAANLGEDADTTAAIAGQLAGALYGTGGIPVRWLDRLAWKPRLERSASALFEASLR